MELGTTSRSTPEESGNQASSRYSTVASLQQQSLLGIKAPKNWRIMAVSVEGTCMSQPGDTTSSDLGGSKYSSKILDDWSWRRVSCEHQLNMGQSILSLCRKVSQSWQGVNPNSFNAASNFYGGRGWRLLENKTSHVQTQLSEPVNGDPRLPMREPKVTSLPGNLSWPKHGVFSLFYAYFHIFLVLSSQFY